MVFTTTPVTKINDVRNNKPIIVLFFMDGCVFCDKMKPAWEKFKKKSPINHSEIDLTNINEYTPLEKEENITGYPTLRLYNKGKLVKEYDGDRSTNNMMEFVEKYMKTKKSKKENLMIVEGKNKANKKLLKALKKNSQKRKKSSKKKKSKKN